LVIWPFDCTINSAAGVGVQMSQNEMKIKIHLRVLVLLIFSMGQMSHAAINRRGLSDQLIADFYAVKSQQVALDAGQVIPVDMKPTDNASQVFSRLADRGMTAFFNSDSFRDSQLGKTTTQVQEDLKTEIIVGDQSNPKSIQHKFNINFEVFQAMAQMTYTGFTNLKIKYKPIASELDFEISEKLDKSKDLVFDHLASSDQRTSQVSVRWTF
jgi:hypothetical protein